MELFIRRIYKTFTNKHLWNMKKVKINRSE